jgi:hypothetical protein
VSPARVEKMLFGAEEITEVFEIQNVSNDSLRIKIAFEDFIIDEDGGTIFLRAESLVNSIAPFTVINPEEFFIKPQDRDFVRMTFRMPKESKIPEYYGMLLFKSQPVPSQYQPMIMIAGEIGVPVYCSVANLATKDASFDSLYVNDDSIIIVLKNAGNIHLRVKGEAKILTTDEKIVEKDSIPEFVVLPEKVRKVKLAIKSNLENGDYLIRVRLDYGALHLMEGERRFKIGKF